MASSLSSLSLSGPNYKRKAFKISNVPHRMDFPDIIQSLRTLLGHAENYQMQIMGIIIHQQSQFNTIYIYPANLSLANDISKKAKRYKGAFYIFDGMNKMTITFPGSTFSFLVCDKFSSDNRTIAIKVMHNDTVDKVISIVHQFFKPNKMYKAIESFVMKKDNVFVQCFTEEIALDLSRKLRTIPLSRHNICNTLYRIDVKNESAPIQRPYIGSTLPISECANKDQSASNRQDDDIIVVTNVDNNNLSQSKSIESSDGIILNEDVTFTDDDKKESSLEPMNNTLHFALSNNPASNPSKSFNLKVVKLGTVELDEMSLKLLSAGTWNITLTRKD